MKYIIYSVCMLLTYGRGGWRGSPTGQHTTFRQSDFTCVLHVEAIFLFGSLFLTSLSNLIAKRNLRELPVSSVGYLCSSEIWPNEMNHI